jgi:hypothetical protein
MYIDRISISALSRNHIFCNELKLFFVNKCLLTGPMFPLLIFQKSFFEIMSISNYSKRNLYQAPIPIQSMYIPTYICMYRWPDQRMQQ